ncbi:Hsp20/alpha crystallin family protein [Novispirillum sp. DQ9]|uniref:Hsp20/alpha crystallin family protein n=1 Tax=Novispirillum sp. DQ9 TaxID=3398612 RepID=UPI003C7E6C7E
MTLRSLLPFGRETLPATDLGGDVFRSLHREIDRVFEDMFRGMPTLDVGRAVPRLDVRDTDTGMEVVADLPGMDEGDIDIRLTDNNLIIQGHKKVESDEEKEGWRLHERTTGSFLRTVPLPYAIEAEKVTAHYDKGVLTIALPKSPTAKETSRRIEVTKTS